MSSQVLPGNPIKPALSYLAHLGISGDLPFADGVRAVARGLPFKAWVAFSRATSLGSRELAAAIGVPERTRARRKATGRRSGSAARSRSRWRRATSARERSRR